MELVFDLTEVFFRSLPSTSCESGITHGKSFGQPANASDERAEGVEETAGPEQELGHPMRIVQKGLTRVRPRSGCAVRALRNVRRGISGASEEPQKRFNLNREQSFSSQAECSSAKF
jgi:hypothetical protein